MKNDASPKLTSSWHKSSFSDQLLNVSCVEQATTTTGAAFRDSKLVNTDGSYGGKVLFFGAASMTSFVGAIATGRLSV